MNQDKIVGTYSACLFHEVPLKSTEKNRTDHQCPSTSAAARKSVRIKITKSSLKEPSILEDEVFTSIDNFSPPDDKQPFIWKKYLEYFKISVLVVIWTACVIMLMTKAVSVREDHQLSVNPDSTREHYIADQPAGNIISVRLQGAVLPKYYTNNSEIIMQVWLQQLISMDPPNNITSFHQTQLLSAKNISKVWSVPLGSDHLHATQVFKEKLFNVDIEPCPDEHHCFLGIKIHTSFEENIPLSISYNLNPINTNLGVMYATLVLVFLYVLIVFEIIHKTLAAMIASTMSVAILAALDARPSMGEIISWMDIETLLLLFSMMTLVAVVSETGIFDYLAVMAFKVTDGKVWPLVNTLCFFTALFSCFLDSVTTALLMTPITIRLCEVMKLNPVPVLTNMIIFSNIGGAITPIGDPPNVMIASNVNVMHAGVDFSVFTLHMSIGVFLVAIAVHIQLRCVYKNSDALRFSEPPDVLELRREIAVWRRTAASMGSYSNEEYLVKDSLIKRTSRLEGKLCSRTSHVPPTPQEFKVNLQDMEKQFPIRDKSLLIKSSLTMCFVITMFFLHSLPQLSRLGMGWTALLGALLLLILSGRDDMDAIFAKVEWGTLLFFACLFILMEALSRLGLIDWIGSQTELVITSVDQEYRLAVAILIILWVSAGASAFVDNIPLTTMMIKITTGLSENKELDLPLQPLVWALAFGACLGGNGTLFGSSSNIVCAGVAEQHGYKFSFVGFMKVGFPVMLVSMIIITVYLLIAHVLFKWH